MSAVCTGSVYDEYASDVKPRTSRASSTSPASHTSLRSHGASSGRSRRHRIVRLRDQNGKNQVTNHVSRNYRRQEKEFCMTTQFTTSTPPSPPRPRSPSSTRTTRSAQQNRRQTEATYRDYRRSNVRGDTTTRGGRNLAGYGQQPIVIALSDRGNQYFAKEERLHEYFK